MKSYLLVQSMESFIYKCKLLILDMYRQETGNRVERWMAYAPLLYNHLLLYPVSFLTSINSVKWLRGVLTKKYFKFHQGFVCASGPTNRTTKSNNFEGGFTIYKCAIPEGEELDDDRLKPLIRMRSQWNFKQQIQIIQQYGNSLQDVNQNNMFAFSYKNYPVVCLISTIKLLEQGTHNQYADANCLKLQGHKQNITCIRWANFQTSSHKLFTSSQDCNIMQWDIQKITLERQLKYHKQSVQALTPLYDFSQEWGEGPTITNTVNSIASVSTDGNIFIWDQGSPVPVCKVNAKQKQLHSVDCISTFGLLTGGSDGSIKMWDLRNLRQYLYESKLDRSCGHMAKVRQLKVNRFFDSSKPSHNKTSSGIGRVKFTTSGDDGKIIEWREKFQFSHEGHENPSTFDLSDCNNLVVSAEKKKNVFMIWEPGVTIGHSE